LFRKARYIVFPNLLLDYPNDLKGFRSMPRRNLCLVYDKTLNKFVGAVYGLDIALGIQFDEFYRENVYGVTVPVEWFWDKWGGGGMGFVHTKPRYVDRFGKYFEIATVESVVQEVDGGCDIDVDDLVEEAMLSGVAVSEVENMYSLAEKLWEIQGYRPLERSRSVQQLELSRILEEIGINNSFAVEVRERGEEIEVRWFNVSKVKVFKVCSCRKALKKVKEIQRAEGVEMWIAIYDVEKGSQCIVGGEGLQIRTVCWREVLDIYKSIGIAKHMLYKI